MTLLLDDAIQAGLAPVGRGGKSGTGRSQGLACGVLFYKIMIFIVDLVGAVGLVEISLKPRETFGSDDFSWWTRRGRASGFGAQIRLSGLRLEATSGRTPCCPLRFTDWPEIFLTSIRMKLRIDPQHFTPLVSEIRIACERMGACSAPGLEFPSRHEEGQRRGETPALARETNEQVIARKVPSASR